MPLFLLHTDRSGAERRQYPNLPRTRRTKTHEGRVHTLPLPGTAAGSRPAGCPRDLPQPYLLHRRCDGTKGSRSVNITTLGYTHVSIFVHQTTRGPIPNFIFIPPSLSRSRIHQAHLLHQHCDGTTSFRSVDMINFITHTCFYPAENYRTHPQLYAHLYAPVPLTMTYLHRGVILNKTN